MAKKNRQIETTMQLEEPINSFGEMITELVFYRPNADVMEVINDSANDGSQALQIVANLTEVDIEDLRRLELIDGLVAMAIGGDIVEKKSAAAEKRCEALGISLQGSVASTPPNDEESETPQPVSDLGQSGEASG